MSHKRSLINVRSLCVTVTNETYSRDVQQFERGFYSKLEAFLIIHLAYSERLP